MAKKEETYEEQVRREFESTQEPEVKESVKQPNKNTKKVLQKNNTSDIFPITTKIKVNQSAFINKNSKHVNRSEYLTNSPYLTKFDFCLTKSCYYFFRGFYGVVLLL